MTLRELSKNEVKRLQAQCLREWEALKQSIPDPGHLIPFTTYEKIWSGGLKAGLAKVDPIDERTRNQAEALYAVYGVLMSDYSSYHFKP